MTTEAPAQAPVRTSSVIGFFVLAFAISWLAWLPTVLDSTVIADLPDAFGILGILGPFGPFIAALVMVFRDRTGVMALLKRGWALDFDKRWLVPTVLLAPATAAVTIGVMTATGQEIQWEYGLAPVAIAPLMSRLGALGASLLLGAVWGLWHLPLHFIEGTVQENILVYQFILQQMVLAVFYTWLFANTRGAVSIAILFHTIANVAGAAVPYWVTEQGRWTGFAVQVAFAVAIVAFWGPHRLSRGPGADVGATAAE